MKYARHGYTTKHIIPGDWNDADDIGELAEAAAEDYFDNRDGFESRWPLSFEIYNDADELIGIIEVEVETQPVFTARIH